MNDRLFVYLVGTAIVCVTLFLGSCTYQAHLCKIEAIKAGMKGEEVRKACI